MAEPASSAATAGRRSRARRSAASTAETRDGDGRLTPPRSRATSACIRQRYASSRSGSTGIGAGQRVARGRRRRRCTPSARRTRLETVSPARTRSNSAEGTTVSQAAPAAALEQRLGRRAGDQPPLAHHGDLARDRLDVGDDVRREQDEPRPEISESRLRKRTRSSGSRPAVGSSTITRSGSPTSACAMPSRWRMPPEKPPTAAVRGRVQVDELEHLEHPCAAARRPSAGRGSRASRTRSGCRRRRSPAAGSRAGGARRRGSRATSMPSKRIRPEVGRVIVAIICMSVVLPAPFGPSSPRTPGPAERLSPRTPYLPRR